MKKSVVAAILIIVILAAGVFGVTAYASDWYRLPVEEWGDRLGIGTDKPADEEKPDDETPGGVVDGDGNVMDPEAVNVMPASMTFTSDKAGNMVKITATITPENATNKNVTWSVAWKNPSSSWASGKSVTDYVTVTPDSSNSKIATYVTVKPDSSNSKIATVTCVKAFSEQVIVTATAAGNTSVKKTCTVDYMNRVLGIQSSTQSYEGIAEYEMFGQYREYIKPTSGQIEDSWTESSCEDPFALKYGEGTITPDILVEFAAIVINCELAEICADYMNPGFVEHSSKTLMRDVTDIYMDDTFAQPGSFLWLMWLIFGENAFNAEVYQTIGAEYDSNNTNSSVSHDEAMESDAYDIAFVFGLYNYPRYYTTFGIDFSCFEIGVADITLSQGSIVF